MNVEIGKGSLKIGDKLFQLLNHDQAVGKTVAIADMGWDSETVLFTDRTALFYKIEHTWGGEYTISLSDNIEDFMSEHQTVLIDYEFFTEEEIAAYRDHRNEVRRKQIEERERLQLARLKGKYES